jgi:hypothetical protein
MQARFCIVLFVCIGLLYVIKGNERKLGFILKADERKVEVFM